MMILGYFRFYIVISQIFTCINSTSTQLHTNLIMKVLLKRKSLFTFAVVLFIIILLDRRRKLQGVNTLALNYQQPIARANQVILGVNPHNNPNSEHFNWSAVVPRYPPDPIISIPKPRKGSIPKIQATFKRETSDERRKRTARLEAVRSNFTHAWRGYKTHAWLKDEVMPISGQSQDPFGGWAATLVDALGKT
jgi:Glycosyl hydrolase family 47